MDRCSGTPSCAIWSNCSSSQSTCPSSSFTIDSRMVRGPAHRGKRLSSSGYAGYPEALETKKPTWRSAPRHSTTSAYSSTSPPCKRAALHLVIRLICPHYFMVMNAGCKGRCRNPLIPMRLCRLANKRTEAGCPRILLEKVPRVRAQKLVPQE